MKEYILDFSDKAKESLRKFKKNLPKEYFKIGKLLEELKIHPLSGTGKPEALKGNWSGYYSRRITDKHRIIYRIEEEIVTVFVVEIGSHYGKNELYCHLDDAFSDVRLTLDGKKKESSLDDLIYELHNSNN